MDTTLITGNRAAGADAGRLAVCALPFGADKSIPTSGWSSIGRIANDQALGHH